MTLDIKPQYVKAELAIRYGSVAAFERLAGLPEKSVHDLLRGRSSTRVRQAVDEALSKPAASAVESELSDSSADVPLAHRLNAGGPLDMATRAKSPVGDTPEVVGQIVLLPVAMIELGDRVRPVDVLAAEGIGRAMRAIGQKKPIEVCRLPGRSHWTVVDGAHRVTGAKSVGLAYLRAEIVENDALARLEREISAGLFSAELAPLDRAAFVGKLIELEKQRAGIAPDQSAQSIAANARWKRDKQEAEDASLTVRGAFGFNDQIADRLGLSVATIERDLMLYRRVPAGLITRLRDADHPALRNAAQLRALAKLDEQQQTAAIDRLLWEEENAERRKPMTLAEAIAAGLQKHNRSPQAADKHFSAFIGNFSRMSLGEKKGALAQLADVLPAGYKLTYGQQTAPNGFPEGYEEEREKALEALDTARELIEGVIEDALGTLHVAIDSERSDALHRASGALQMTRMAIACDAVPMASVPEDRA